MIDFQPHWFGFESVAKDADIDNQLLIDEGWIVGAISVVRARITLQQYFDSRFETQHLQVGAEQRISKEFLDKNQKILRYIRTREMPVMRMVSMELMSEHPLLGNFAEVKKRAGSSQSEKSRSIGRILQLPDVD